MNKPNNNSFGNNNQQNNNQEVLLGTFEGFGLIFYIYGKKLPNNQISYTRISPKSGMKVHLPSNNTPFNCGGYALFFNTKPQLALYIHDGIGWSALNWSPAKQQTNNININNFKNNNQQNNNQEVLLGTMSFLGQEFKIFGHRDQSGNDIYTKIFINNQYYDIKTTFTMPNTTYGNVQFNFDSGFGQPLMLNAHGLDSHWEPNSSLNNNINRNNMMNNNNFNNNFGNINQVNNNNNNNSNFNQQNFQQQLKPEENQVLSNIQQFYNNQNLDNKYQTVCSYYNNNWQKQQEIINFYKTNSNNARALNDFYNKKYAEYCILQYNANFWKQLVSKCNSLESRISTLKNFLEDAGYWDFASFLRAPLVDLNNQQKLKVPLHIFLRLEMGNHQ